MATQLYASSKGANRCNLINLNKYTQQPSGEKTNQLRKFSSLPSQAAQARHFFFPPQSYGITPVYTTLTLTTPFLNQWIFYNAKWLLNCLLYLLDGGMLERQVRCALETQSLMYVSVVCVALSLSPSLSHTPVECLANRQCFRLLITARSVVVGVGRPSCLPAHWSVAKHMHSGMMNETSLTVIGCQLMASQSAV